MAVRQKVEAAAQENQDVMVMKKLKKLKVKLELLENQGAYLE